MMIDMAKRIAIGLGVLLLAIPVAGFVLWLTVGDGAWLSNVEVFEVNRSDTGEVFVFVNSCNANPRLSRFENIDGVLVIQVEAFSTPLSGGNDCADGLRIGGSNLQETTLRDTTSGEEFEIPAAS